MRQSNSTQNALGAFKKLGAVALITATLAMCFTACKQTVGETPKPKHAITFSVDSTTPNGTLKAKSEGIYATEESPITVEEGKTVTFTAKANDGYKIGKWTVAGSELEAGTGADGSETAKVKITADTTVKVSFEAIPKHAITFSVEGDTGGTLEAKVDGKEITSGNEVEQGKTVTFTTKTNDGYRVKGWTLDGNAVNGTAETYTLTVSQAATVKVSFELVAVEGEAELTLSPGSTYISVKAKTADGSAIVVKGCDKTTLESDTAITLTATDTKVVLKGKITELSCSSNKLTSLNVHGCTSLKSLYCSYNQLTSLNVQGCADLQKLYCFNNQLTSLDVQGLTSLQELYCENNKLTSLNVQGCAALQTLFCPYNQLISLNVQDLTSLQTLFCGGNQLSDLNVQGCTSLKMFFCNRNQLNAQAMTKLLEALPAREVSDSAKALLYTEKTGVTEGNCKNFTQPADLQAAFDKAKTNKHWKLQKVNASGDEVGI